MVKHSQSFKNCKFGISLQYFKKEVRDEVEFLNAYKHQSFLQGDAFEKCSKWQVWNIFTILLKKNLGM